MLLKNADIVFPDKVLRSDIRVTGSRICEISTHLFPLQGEKSYDLDGYLLTPGFVDIHTHGGYGADFMDSNDEAFEKALRFHSDNGTTSVIATSCTASRRELVNFIDYVREYKNKKRNVSDRARVLGAHLEGPYLSVAKRGAQKLEDLKTPSLDDYSYILQNADVIKTVTLSPELEGADEACKALSKSGILVSGGHDDGIYPEFMPAVKNGLRHVTHLYCAMSELRFKDGVRNVGLREYALVDDGLTAEIIADNKHIPPLLAKMIYRAKGADRLCVVSDSLRCAGLDDKNALYSLGTGKDAQKVMIKDGVAVLENGITYAGSITSVREMVKNLIDIGIPIVDAVKMGTETPAKIVKECSIGEITIGKTADICILNKNFGVEKVMINGIWTKGE